MKILQGTALLVSLMSGTGLVFTGLPVLASIDAECRQEAEDYGIPPEQLEEYVTGCVLSRGGDYVEDPAVQEYTAPQEDASGNDPGMGADYVGDPEVQDYTMPQEIDMDNDSGMGGEYVPQ